MSDELKQFAKAYQTLTRLIEAGDNRLLASDGPAGGAARRVSDIAYFRGMSDEDKELAKG